MPTLKVAIDARGAKRGAKQYTDATKSMGGATQKAIGAIKSMAAAYVGLKTAMDAIKTAMAFEDQMAELQTVVQGTALEMEHLSDTAREMGQTTKFSATQAAEGLTFLGRAGYSAIEAAQALPGVLATAAAANLDLAKAADIASNIMGQFQLAVGDTARIGDVLVNTANSANTNVEQLAEAMKYAGPLAGALGVSMEDAAAAIGVMGDNGIQASQAGTNLKGIFAALLDPTTKAKAAFEEMGLKLEDLNPQTNDLVDIFDKLQTSGMDAGQALRIFGRLNVSAAMAVKNSVIKMRELAKANKEAEGASKRAADVMSRTLGGKIKALNSALEELKLQFAGEGTGLNSILKETVMWATDLASVLGGNDEKMRTSSDSVAMVAGAFKLLGSSMELVGEIFTNLANHVGNGLADMANMMGIEFHGEVGTFLEDFGRMEHSSIVFREGMIATFKQITEGLKLFLIEPFSKALSEQMEAWKEFGNFISIALKSPLEGVLMAIAAFGASVLQILATIIQGFANLASHLPGIGASVARELGGAAQGVRDYAKEIVVASRDLTGDVGADMVDSMEKVKTHFSNAAHAGIEGLTKFEEKMAEFKAKRAVIMAEMSEAVATRVTSEIEQEASKFRQLAAMQKAAADEKDKEMQEIIQRELDAHKKKNEATKKLDEESKVHARQNAWAMASFYSDAYGQIAGNLATMTEDMAKHSKEAFYLHKAFALSQAIINSFLAYSNVMASPLAASNPVLAQVMAGTAFGASMMQANQIASATYQGGRALGGQVGADSFVRVGENGPELIQSGQQTMLVTGDKGAKVSPMGGGGVNVNVNIIGGKGNEEVVQRENSDGGVDIDIIMGQVNGRLSAGLAENDSYHKSLESTFGLSRGSGLRG